jgi:hypothetical protein
MHINQHKIKHTRDTIIRASVAIIDQAALSSSPRVGAEDPIDRARVAMVGSLKHCTNEEEKEKHEIQRYNSTQCYACII